MLEVSLPKKYLWADFRPNFCPEKTGWFRKLCLSRSAFSGADVADVADARRAQLSSGGVQHLAGWYAFSPKTRI